MVRNALIVALLLTGCATRRPLQVQTAAPMQASVAASSTVQPSQAFIVSWDFPQDGFDTGFTVEHKPELNAAWQRLGSVTNAAEFRFTTTGKLGFLRVYSFNP